MRLALAVALALLAAACSDSPCLRLGERLCSCTGLSSDSCRTQVQTQLDSAGISESDCEAYLASCNAPMKPDGTQQDLCEWMLTPEGKQACGVALPAAQ